jgi:hypothetical protein
MGARLEAIPNAQTLGSPQRGSHRPACRRELRVVAVCRRGGRGVRAPLAGVSADDDIVKLENCLHTTLSLVVRQNTKPDIIQS